MSSTCRITFGNNLDNRSLISMFFPPNIFTSKVMPYRIKDVDEDGMLVRSVLFIGDSSGNLGKFATIFLHNADCLKQTVKVYTADRLPLTESDVVTSIIVVIVDLGNKETLTTCKYFIQFIPPKFFMGQLLFVGLNISNEQSWCVEPEELSEIANEYGCPILWGCMDNPQSMSVLTQQIMKKLEMVVSGKMPPLLHTGVSNMSDYYV